MNAMRHLGDTRWCLASLRLAGAIGRDICPPAADLFEGLLLPLPNFGNCAAGGIYFVFESAATGAKRDLLGIGSEKQHAAVADCAAGAEFSHARSLPGNAFALLRHVDSFAFAINGAIRADDRCVSAHAGGSNTKQVAAIFERHFYGWWVSRNDPSYASLTFCFADLFSKHGFTSSFTPL